MLLEDPVDQNVKPRRPVVVQKYGGSSVADVDKLGAVADRVVSTRRGGADVVVVVSAMGKTTDALLALARQVTDGDPPRRELDMLLSTGERVAMSLLSIAIQARGLDAISFTGSQCGIITNDRHFDARIIEVRPHRIEDEIARGRVVIVAGYQGMSYRREITTLGRGGTDTTAVALAAALSAERCEIYSDVDGVYTADPRCVPDAAHLPELDYAMLQEMAESGAKVVCAQAVEWARRAGVALYARSTFDRSGDARQTVVRKDTPVGARRARAVTVAPQIIRASAQDGATLLQAAAELRLSPIHVQQRSDRGAELWLSLINAPDWSSAQAALRARAPDLHIDESFALVSVVGSGLSEHMAAIGAARQALADGGIEAHEMVASALRISALVPRQKAEEAQRVLHDALVTRS